MPQTPYLVSGTVYTERGTVSNSVVQVNSDLKAITDSKGQYVMDLANLSSGYTANTEYTITAVDEYDNEFVTDTITVTGQNQTKNLFTSSRTDKTDQTRNSETRRVETRTIGNKPVTKDNLLPVENVTRPFSKQLQNYSSGQPRYIGEASPGTPVGQPKWRIREMIYADGTTKPPTGELWANGNAEFDKIWDNRADYQYN